MATHAMLQPLTEMPNWVCWKYETRKGRKTKVPYTTTGVHASVADPATWTDHASAAATAEAGGYDGIGFVLTEHAGITGVDLDHCIDPDTGEIQPAAQEIVDRLQSYTEITPSGEGLRILLQGRLSGTGNRKRWRGIEVEIYSRGRYLTVTGRQLAGCPATVEPRQEALDELHGEIFAQGVRPDSGRQRTQATGGREDTSDQDLLQMARAARNGAEFRALYDQGDTSAYGGDDSRADLALCNILCFWCGPDQARIDRIFRTSALMRPKWDRADYREGTIGKALRDVREHYRPAGGDGGNGHKRTEISAEPAPAPELHLTDIGNAERLVQLHGQDVRYCHSTGEWMVWTGTRWMLDTTAEIHRLAISTVRSIYGEAERCPDREQRKRIANWAKASEASTRLNAMISVAQGILPVSRGDFDCDPWLLNCLNGTLDLRTGDLMPHRREDLISRICPVEYCPDADSDIWQRYLATAVPDADLREFLARAAGYTLTGDVGEEVLFFLHGPGGSGKSTFVESLRAALGDYSATLDFNVLLKSRHDVDGRSANPEVAKLPGIRCAISIEVNEGRRLAEGLVKTLTGGDTVSARGLYERRNTEFAPQFKLWLVANDAPVIRDTDDALWRRVLIIPFLEALPAERRDPGVKQHLRYSPEGRAAILAWAVRGCLAWQEQRLGVPAAVAAATSSLRREMDPLQDFFEECCQFHPAFDTAAADIRGAYEDWCEANGQKPIAAKGITERLKTHGCTTFRAHGGRRMWSGIRLHDAVTRGDAVTPVSNNFPSDSSHMQKHMEGDVTDVTFSRPVNTDYQYPAHLPGDAVQI